MRALDQAGNVGRHKAVVAYPHHAKVWLERRKRVGANLGPRGADDREQRRFAGIRKANQPDISQQLQLQVDLIRLARLAKLSDPRHLVGRSGEMDIAEAALTTARRQ